MDLEIRQANFAGLDYWAFVAYGDDDPMSAALSKYLTSPNNKQLNFCMFTELNRWGTASQPSTLVSQHLALMKRSEYVRVFDGRPLYYLGFIDHKSILERWGSLDRLRQRIQIFREQCIAEGSSNPYIVLAGLFTEIEEWSSLGGDAIGAYAISDPRGTGSYSALANIVEQRWQELSEQGLPVVPTVVTGWDRRPRIEHPVPWERTQIPGAGIEYHFEPPKPDELATHLKQAFHFIEAQPPHQKAPAVLIYAWNENDEGGWLVPTVPCETERLQALHDVLAKGRQVLNPECRVRP